MDYIAREDALALLKRYNQDPFHLQHAFTVEAVMKWYANELGYAEDAEYWGIVGLLHDIDFEQYPEEHCLKAPELLREGGVGEDIIHSVVSHGYGITIGCGVTLDVAPEHEMEKVLFAADELTGLDLGGSADASFQKYKRHGTEILKEKIQKQRIRCRMLQRSHPARSRSARLGTGKTADDDNGSNESNRRYDQCGV